MQTDDVINWVCQYCGEENELWLDLTVLENQDFIEDCEVCCRPNRILIKHDKEDEEYIFVESRITDEQKLNDNFNRQKKSNTAVTQF